MEKTTLAQAYEKLIWQRFPEVLVFSGLGGPEDTPVLDAFWIPDSELKVFWKYLLDELPILAQNAELDWATIVPHSAEATRTYYPEVPQVPLSTVNNLTEYSVGGPIHFLENFHLAITGVEGLRYQTIETDISLAEFQEGVVNWVSVSDLGRDWIIAPEDILMQVTHCTKESDGNLPKWNINSETASLAA